jgi:hypothetical protein
MLRRAAASSERIQVDVNAKQENAARFEGGFYYSSD